MKIYILLSLFATTALSGADLFAKPQESNRKAASTSEFNCYCNQVNKKCDDSFERIILNNFDDEGASKFTVSVGDQEFEVSDEITYSKSKTSSSIFIPKSKKMAAYNGVAPKLIVQTDFNHSGGVVHLVSDTTNQSYTCKNTDLPEKSQPQKKSTAKKLSVSCKDKGGKVLDFTSEIENANEPQKITSFSFNGSNVKYKDISKMPIYKNGDLEMHIQFGQGLYNDAEISLTKCTDSFAATGVIQGKEYVGGFAGTKPLSMTCSCSLQ